MAHWFQKLFLILLMHRKSIVCHWWPCISIVAPWEYVDYAPCSSVGYRAIWNLLCPEKGIPESRQEIPRTGAGLDRFFNVHRQFLGTGILIQISRIIIFQWFLDVLSQKFEKMQWYILIRIVSVTILFNFDETKLRYFVVCWDNPHNMGFFWRGRDS